MCLKLSLLNLSHHFHLTCINYLFFLVQVDLILNSHLWVCPSPIPQLQHTILPPKCCKLKIVPQFYFIFRCFALGPTFGSIKKFGGTPTKLLRSWRKNLCRQLRTRKLKWMKKMKRKMDEGEWKVPSWMVIVISKVNQWVGMSSHTSHFAYIHVEGNLFP